MSNEADLDERVNNAGAWYELFSRGARDWLRHNEKVRDAVRDQLSDLISQAQISEDNGERRVQVPVKFLEHYRFRLSDPSEQSGVGQGKAAPGDELRRAGQNQDETGAGGNSEGAIEFVLDVPIDDIVDWLWEELKLPDLRQKQGRIEDEQFEREGWNRRGVRSRLDRRRSLKESIKRRSVLGNGPAVVNDDLRYRQLVKRQKPSSNAVVFFVMDVSASMTQRDRQLAKTFFFWVVQGLKRQYQHLRCEFIAHTERAWTFSETEFFAVKGSGGTVASTAFELVRESLESDYDPSNYNSYVFYASDGDNYTYDHEAALQTLMTVLKRANCGGFIQVGGLSSASGETEMADIFTELEYSGLPVSSYFLRDNNEVWDAIKTFFQESQVGAGIA